MAFSNRAEAAGRLVELLRAWPTEHLIVVTLAPRGVALATSVASALGRPLDAVVVDEVAIAGCPHGVLGAAADRLGASNYAGVVRLTTHVVDVHPWTPVLFTGLERLDLEPAISRGRTNPAPLHSFERDRCAHRLKAWLARRQRGG